MNKLIPFQFESSLVRVVIVDGVPMLSARDVALVLGYTNPSKAYQDHCKSLKKLSYNELLELKWVSPNTQGEYVIPKSDVLRLVIKSTKQEAEQFERWVFEDVLPSIIDTGSYFLPNSSVSSIHELTNAMIIAREGAKLARAFGFKGNMIALSGNTLAKTVTGVDMLALMGATHLIADPRGMTYTPTELGAMCDPKLSAIKFNLLLEAAGLQTKEYGSWLPTDAADGKFEWLDTNKRHTDGTPVKQIKWFSSVLNDVAAPKIRATA